MRVGDPIGGARAGVAAAGVDKAAHGLELWARIFPLSGPIRAQSSDRTAPVAEHARHAYVEYAGCRRASDDLR